MPRGRKPGLFDEIHGKGALARLCSMLDNPAFNYQSIALCFGISRQRIAQIADKLGVDARRRQRERALKAMTFYDSGNYPANVKAVAREIERLGMKVEPYRLLRRSGNLAFTQKRTLLIDGVPCQIHCRREASKTRSEGREYVLFRTSAKTKRAKAAIFAFWRNRAIKLFVVPTRELKKISRIWLPADGRYAENHNIKPKRDWTV